MPICHVKQANEFPPLSAHMEGGEASPPHLQSTAVSYCGVTEPAVLDDSWGGNRELARRKQEVRPHAPYFMQS